VPRINHHLKEWGAVGFRAGFMFHELEWFHTLNIEYDASTFDTDPFEPQPDGVNTIFPFWVPARSAGKQNCEAILNSSRDRVGATVSPVCHAATRPHAAERDSQWQLPTLNHPRGGYVELPYTLAQDSTLFIYLRERSIDIWKRKAAWVAQCGGMLLLNSHPDYMSFGERACSWDEFDVSLYQEFLIHMRNTYKEAYWHALPCEIARFVRSERSVTSTPVPPEGQKQNSPTRYQS
jgi:hypothetical protein